MPRAHRRERTLFVYRAQFIPDASLFLREGEGDPEDLRSFLKDILEMQSSPDARSKYKNWRIANFVQEPDFPTVLAFRAGHIAASRAEHFVTSEWRFEEAHQEESESSAVIFESETEYLLIEKNSQLDADLVVRRLEYIFNSAPAERRFHRALEIYEIRSPLDAVDELASLRSIYTFKAWLRKPNPRVARAYQKLYEGLSQNSGSTEQTVAWKSPSGELSIQEDSPIRGAVEMSADSYGNWKAVGKKRNGARKELQSDQPVESIRINVEVPTSLIKRAFDGIQHFLRSRERVEVETVDSDENGNSARA